MAQADVVLEARPAQIKVAIMQPHIFGHRSVLGDRKRRRLRLVQDTDFAHEYLDLARRKLWIDCLLRSTLDDAFYGDDVLGTEPLRGSHQGLIIPDNEL